MDMPINPNDNITYDFDKLEKIYIAGGCFWGLEAYVRRLYGVTDTECGYANGKTENPTYEEVCNGDTYHAETVRVLFFPEYISLEKLLREVFEVVDIYRKQDEKDQYRNCVYFENENQKKIIDTLIKTYEVEIPTTIEVKEIQCYYPGEDYLQDYLEKNPNGFCHINLSKLKNK